MGLLLHISKFIPDLGDISTLINPPICSGIINASDADLLRETNLFVALGYIDMRYHGLVIVTIGFHVGIEGGSVRRVIAQRYPRMAVRMRWV